MLLKYTLFVWALFFILIQSTIQKRPREPEMPKEVLKFLCSRHMRYHHFLWHNLREGWPLLDKKTQRAITRLGWRPDRPSISYNEKGEFAPLENNGSGEDFLYMHAEMTKKVHRIAKSVGSDWRVKGWESVPGPYDRDYPCPRKYKVPGEDNDFLTELIANYKSDDFYYDEIIPAEKALKDPKRLRKMSLGQLGSIMEYTVHTYLHLRFSEPAVNGDYRASVYNPFPEIDRKYDKPSYNWLADTYAAHCNPVFWKIHGWVNDRIEDWMDANNLKEVNWKNIWVGGSMSLLGDLFEVGLESDAAKQDPLPTSENDDDYDNDNDYDVDDRKRDGEYHNLRRMKQVDEHVEVLETMEEVMSLLAEASREQKLASRIKVEPPTRSLFSL